MTAIYEFSVPERISPALSILVNAGKVISVFTGRCCIVASYYAYSSFIFVLTHASLVREQ
jgi:hypothetical protein